MSPFWLKLLPSFIRSKIEHRDNLLNVLVNTGWLFADKAMRMVVGLLVGVWVARYLGPEQYGLFNYAAAFVALFGAIASLGLNSIVVRDLVREPETANVTLGTAFILQIVGGLIACLLAIMAINVIRPEDALLKLIVAVIGFGLVVKATEVIKYWFESQVKSSYVVLVENGALLIFASIKIGLILYKASLMAFVWVSLAELIVVSAGLFWIYSWYVGKVTAWHWSAERAKTLLINSWPLILSSLAIMVYMRIDQIMLGEMVGNGAVGVYSAAVRISESWYFIAIAVVSSVFPSIMASKDTSDELYNQRMQKLYHVMVLLAVAGALPITLGSNLIINIMFGSDYAAAAPILAIHTWTSIFVFLGVASARWLVLENLQMHAFYRTGLGAIINIFANLILIPKYGAIGAAIGTLISQIVAAYLFDILSVRTRQSFRQKTASLFLFITVMRKRFA